jgi:hypothetical protein
MKFTRRKFLKTAAGTALVAGAGGWVIAPRFADPQNPLPTTVPPLFPDPSLIRYDSHCFTIRGRDTFLFSASMHYPRCPEPLWRDRLEKLRRAGFNTIETYVFWNYHEPVEGQVDLSEFDRFARLVGEMGFWMIARPGPYVCAEWDAGGFPHWVIARQFPLRSNAPESIRTSRHWYDQVLPVIARHQITRGGPVILMQLENEYNYWKLADADKRAYVTALAEMAWNNGIVVPLITCWTEQVRERGDAAMTHIADFSNFYPRWNIVKEVIPGLQALRREEPNSPVGVTELQGGWFSQVGGSLSHDQRGIGPPQINMISKTTIEQGAAFFNYYMGFGGTNFDWAAKGLTTTYDYDAPLREPGGLGDKYYVARGVGASLHLLGETLARAEQAEAQPESTRDAVSATLRLARRNGRATGALFLRENANADQTFHLRLPDLERPGRMHRVPRRGALFLRARGMRLCPIGLAFPGGELRYSTAEVLAHGDAGRRWLILYDDPERPVEFSLAAERPPRILGPSTYRVRDSAARAEIIGMRTNEAPRMLLVDDLQVILLQRVTALRTWIAEFPRAVVTGEPGNGKPVSIPFLSDAAQLTAGGHSARGIHADLEFLSGDHTVTALLPRRPSACRVNGDAVEVDYDAQWQTARIQIAAPGLPVQPVDIRHVDTWVERFDPALGHWSIATLQALEKTGPIPYGYVKYRRQFTARGDETLTIVSFADDGKKVFLNGKLVPKASVPTTHTEASLAGFAKPGANTLEICYELFGSPNFGPKIAELKGIESAALASVAGPTPLSGPWQMQRVSAPMRGRRVDPDFHSGPWKPSAIANGSKPGAMVPAFTWCRATFSLDQPPANWQIPWRVTLDAARDALLYLNGEFVGRYSTAGPQSAFFLPASYLRFGADRQNVLTIVLAYAEDTRAISTLRVEPYHEFSLWRSRIEFDW